MTTRGAHRPSSCVHQVQDYKVKSHLSAHSSISDLQEFGDWQDVMDRKSSADHDASSGRPLNSYGNMSRASIKLDTDEDYIDGSVERRTLYFGLLFLLLVIAGDIMRLVVERLAISYKGNSEGEALVGHTVYVFSLSITSSMSVIGVLGLSILFVMSAQVSYTSRILLPPSVSMMRAITADERQLVRASLECYGRQQQQPQPHSSNSDI